MSASDSRFLHFFLVVRVRVEGEIQPFFVFLVVRGLAGHLGLPLRRRGRLLVLFARGLLFFLGSEVLAARLVVGRRLRIPVQIQFKLGIFQLGRAYALFLRRSSASASVSQKEATGAISTARRAAQTASSKSASVGRADVHRYQLRLL